MCSVNEFVIDVVAVVVVVNVVVFCLATVGVSEHEQFIVDAQTDPR